MSTFSGTSIAVDGALDNADMLILPAFWGDFDALCARYPQVAPWLRERHAAGSIICGEATGAFWMAQAGLLEGREATTHWRFAGEFAERFPGCSSAPTSTSPTATTSTAPAARPRPATCTCT